MPGPHGLPDDLMHPARRYAPEELTFVETIGRQAGLNKDQIHRAQSGLSDGLAATRIWLSDLDEVPGFRRLAFAGVGSERALAYAVTDTGGFLISSLEAPDIDARPIGEMISELLDGKDSWQTARYFASHPFDLNHYSRDGQWLRGRLHGQRIDPVREMLSENDETGTVDRFFGKLSGMLWSRAGRNGGGIRKAIKEALDPDVFKLAWGTKMTHGEGLCWLTGTRAPEMSFRQSFADCLARTAGDVPRNRQQALAAFPAMGGVLTTPEISSSIDAGHSVKRALAKFLNIPEAKTSLLQGLGARAIGNPSSLDEFEVLHHLPADLAPRSGKGWRALWDAGKALDYLFSPKKYSSWDTGFDARIAERTAANIRAHARQIGSFSERYPDISSRNAADMFEALNKQLVIPSLALSDDPRLAQMSLDRHQNSMQGIVSAEIYLNSSLKDIQASSERWHRSIHRIEDRLAPTSDGLSLQSWPALLGALEERGLKITEMTSEGMLSRRGREENHCVGGYGSQVRAAARQSFFSLIYAIDGDEGPVSTLQIQVQQHQDGRHDAQIVQNRANSNAAPDAVAGAVAEDILTRINALGRPEIDTYRIGMQAYDARRDAHLASLSPLERSCDVPFRRPGYLEDAWEALSPCLPRGMRKAGPEAFAARFVSHALALEEASIALMQDIRESMPKRHLDVVDPLDPDYEIMPEPPEDEEMEIPF